LLFLGSVVACAASPPVSPAPPPSVATSSPQADAAATTSTLGTQTPLGSLDAVRRDVLGQLVGFDTSHGHEIDALRPIAARFEGAGVHAQLIEAAPGRGNLVARFPGSGAKKPLLLLAHIDVVPIEGQPWTVPPFHTTEKDGFIYGRGVSDDKGMASAFVAIGLGIAHDHVDHSRDIIIALTSGEETDGMGIRWLLDHRRELVDAELALNEGGGVIVSDDFSHVEGVSVGVAEKIFQSYRLVAKGPGGHSSIPPTDVDPVATLARALERVASLRFSARALPAVKEQLAFLAKHEKDPVAGALLRVAKSAPLVAPADEKILRGQRVYNALIRTTCVTTMLQASPQDNVLPTTAEAVVNCRILPDETPDQTRVALERVINDRAVAVTLAPTPPGFGPYSDIDAGVMDAVRKAAARWPGAVVFPAMATGASDSRYLRAAGIPAYGLDACPSSRLEEREGRTAHGPDERLPVRWLDDGLFFLRDVVLEVAR